MASKQEHSLSGHWADFPQPLFAAGAVFAWCQAQPGGKISTRGKMPRLCCQRHGCHDHLPDTGYFRLILAQRSGCQLNIKTADPLFQSGDMRAHLLKHGFCDGLGIIAVISLSSTISELFPYQNFKNIDINQSISAVSGHFFHNH